MKKKDAFRTVLVVITALLASVLTVAIIQLITTNRQMSNTYENVFFGHEIMNGGTINWNETIVRAKEELKKVRLDVDPSLKVKQENSYARELLSDERSYD